MGREIRRVPLDFDWPLNKVWKGFINPHRKPCPEDQKTCFNGITAGAQWLEAVCRFMCTLADDARRSDEPRSTYPVAVPHPYMVGFPTAPHYETPADKAAEFDKLEGRERTMAYYRYHESIPPHERILRPSKDFLDMMNGIMGKDAPTSSRSWDGYLTKSYAVYFKILEAANLNKDWGTCPVCKGKCIDPAVQEAYEAWKPEGPPEGPGYQIWETVSEGSPITKVFATKGEIVKHLVANGYSTEAAESFSDVGWAPSMVFVGGKAYDDIESCAVLNK